MQSRRTRNSSALDATHVGLQLRTYRKEVSPELAQAWLEKGSLNGRLPNPRVVALHAKALRSGDWRPTTEDPLLMTDDGRLVNNGCRLAAIIEAGVTVPLWIVEVPTSLALRMLQETGGYWFTGRNKE